MFMIVGNLISLGLKSLLGKKKKKKEDKIAYFIGLLGAIMN